jgi:CBS domain-containing protein
MQTMAEHDIGSLVVMEHGDLVGMLTFREVIKASPPTAAAWARGRCVR